MLAHPGVDQHIRVQELQHLEQVAEKHRDALTGLESFSQEAWVNMDGGGHAFELSRAVERGVGEGHAPPGRRRGGIVADPHPVPGTEQAVGYCRAHVANPSNRNSRHRQLKRPAPEGAGL
jgi:hypothetical protein